MSKRYYYLLYSSVFLFPPVHEIGHVFIAWFFNVKVVKLEFAMCYFESYGSNMHWQTQIFYDLLYPIITAISITCITVFILMKCNIKFKQIKKTHMREEVIL